MKRPAVRMLSQADPRRNASLGVAAAAYDPARPVAVGIPATAFLPSLVLTAFLSDANAIYTTVAIACSQTLVELTPFGLVLEAIRYTNIGTLKTSVPRYETRLLCPVQRTNPLIQGTHSVYAFVCRIASQ